MSHPTEKQTHDPGIQPAIEEKGEVLEVAAIYTLEEEKRVLHPQSSYGVLYAYVWQPPRTLPASQQSGFSYTSPRIQCLQRL
jgi:hypothetical protein